MSNLTKFLLARIAEDEAVAQETMRRAVADPYTDAAEVTLYSNEAASSGSPIVAATPARILAECEAKRRIVELHAPRYAVVYRESERLLAEAFDQDKVRALASSGPIWPYPASEQTLLALAQPYADHPDFDPAWRLG